MVASSAWCKAPSDAQLSMMRAMQCVVWERERNVALSCIISIRVNSRSWNCFAIAIYHVRSLVELHAYLALVSLLVVIPIVLGGLGQCSHVPVS